VFLLLNYWPVLAVLVVGSLPLVGLLIWTNRLTISGLAVYISIELIMAVAAQQVLKEAGLIGVFAGEYNQESIEAFTQICLLGCQSPDGQTDVCPRYCGCVVNQARNVLSYEDMLARTVKLGDDRANEAWALADQNCRRNLRLR
jgi:hypothetical protein